MTEPDTVPPWKLASDGISLFINNRPEEAKQLFTQNENSIQMTAGLSFVTFMDAVMSLEEDKIQEAFSILNETDKKCNVDSGWFKTIKTRMFGTRPDNFANYLEGQIILGDVQVFISILTFLQQDISSYLKGAWCLRKAWKIYQRVYTQLVDVYRKKIGPFNLPTPSNFSWQQTDGVDESAPSTSKPPKVTNKRTTSKSSQNLNLSQNPSTTDQGPSQVENKNETNGYIYNIDNQKTKLPHSYSTYSVTNSPKTTGKLPRSMSSYENSKPNSFFTPITMQLSYLSDSLGNISLLDINIDSIDPETVMRLMGAVCFGYGLIQLCISLLPPGLMRLTNIFGFSGNRSDGISHLMYSRQGEDMRAPIATLTLLMYHTIIRPFFAIDGTNLSAGLEATNLLLKESEVKYYESALFLFFKGRMLRLNVRIIFTQACLISKDFESRLTRADDDLGVELKSNIPAALASFELSVANSNQREVKVLSLHEVGWCHLILLDYESAQRTFMLLKTYSRWSRTFYIYILIACLGSRDQLKEYDYIVEMSELLKTSNQKNSQIEIFLARREKTFPPKDGLDRVTTTFWKLFVYELLFLWNSLPSCDKESINDIIHDCDNDVAEPMPGIAMLIQGECYTIIGAIPEAIESFRKGLAIRKTQSLKDYLHISAYTEFALGLLLVKEKKTFAEGKALIQHAGDFKNYDFDSKLQTRIEQTLKNL